MIGSRIDARGRTTLPASVRDALELRPGDLLDWRIAPGRAVVTRAAPEDDLFATFDEWASRADSEGYANL